MLSVKLSLRVCHVHDKKIIKKPVKDFRVRVVYVGVSAQVFEILEKAPLENFGGNCR